MRPARDLAEALVAALLSGDRALLGGAGAAGGAVLGGIEPGRPLGAAYYLYRVLRALDADAHPAPSAGSRGRRARPAGTAAGGGGLEERFEEFRRALEGEIRRLLVADRGAAAVARALRRPLVDEADLTTATAAELAEIERAL